MLAASAVQTSMVLHSPGGCRFLDSMPFGAHLDSFFWPLASALMQSIWPF